jgi:hypothetical protein
VTDERQTFGAIESTVVDADDERTTREHASRARARARKKASWRLFGQTGIVGHACEEVGISRRRPYTWAEKDPVFARKFAEAGERATDLLEAVARKRAFEGSDDLVKFLLRGKRAEFRDKVDLRHTGPGGGPIQMAAKVEHSVDPDLRDAAILAALVDAGVVDDPAGPGPGGTAPEEQRGDEDQPDEGAHP